MCWMHRGAAACAVELVEGKDTDKYRLNSLYLSHHGVLALNCSVCCQALNLSRWPLGFALAGCISHPLYFCLSFPPFIFLFLFNFMPFFCDSDIHLFVACFRPYMFFVFLRITDCLGTFRLTFVRLRCVDLCSRLLLRIQVPSLFYFNGFSPSVLWRHSTDWSERTSILICSL